MTTEGSTKKTYHISLKIDPALFSFKVGDSIGVLPQNDWEEVEMILGRLGVSGDEKIVIREFLRSQVNISRVNSAFLKFLLGEGDSLFHSENRALLTEFLHSHTLLELLQRHSLPDLSALKKLMPLLPRFYSIANAPSLFPDEIHLTVAYVSYLINGQLRKGIGSHFLCTHAEPGVTKVPIYLQPSHGFSLPADPHRSIILVGPGTGVAPFRGFLQERIAQSAPGLNWLFFGERNHATDFYYGDFWLELERLGRLRLDLAFSRDTEKKIYVQHRMYERRKSLWAWLEEGSYFYLCGNAGAMVRDVEGMLLRIFREEGKLSDEEARQKMKMLRAEGRYLMDVY